MDENTRVLLLKIAKILQETAEDKRSLASAIPVAEYLLSDISRGVGNPAPQQPEAQKEQTSGPVPEHPIPEQTSGPAPKDVPPSRTPPKKPELIKVGGRELPPELARELVSSEQSDRDQQVLQSAKNHRPSAFTVNELLIWLYEDHGVIEKRTSLTSRLHRLQKLDHIEKHKNKRGFFKLPSVRPVPTTDPRQAQRQAPSQMRVSKY